MSQSYDDGRSARRGEPGMRSLPALTGGTPQDLDLKSALTKEPVTVSNLEDAMTVIKKCFSLEADIRAARSTYERYISDERVYDSKFSGTRIELLSYQLYRLGGQPAAVVGAYRHIDEPGRLYMGWLGVSPEFRKSRLPDMKLLSEVIMADTIALAHAEGAATIAAIAEDAQSNHTTHRYYERHGFTIERVFERNGETDRLYVRNLAQRIPFEPPPY